MTAGRIMHAKSILGGTFKAMPFCDELYAHDFPIQPTLKKFCLERKYGNRFRIGFHITKPPDESSCVWEGDVCRCSSKKSEGKSLLLETKAHRNKISDTVERTQKIPIIKFILTLEASSDNGKNRFPFVVLGTGRDGKGTTTRKWGKIVAFEPCLMCTRNQQR